MTDELPVPYEAEEQRSPMTIKAVPKSTRLDMVAIARRRGMSQADLMVHMVEKAREAGTRDLVESLHLFEKPLPPPVKPEPGSDKLSMADLRDAVAAVRSIGETTGVKPPKVIARHVYALIGQRLREERGLPPLAPRQTRRKSGQTIEADGDDA
jgi:hypothetical protein